MADSFFAHPTSIIDDGASIGANSKVWHFCHVMPGATIGADCTLGQNVFVASRVTIGKGVKIQNNVSVYDGVVIEDDVFCGPSMVFTNVLAPRSPFPSEKRDYLETLIRRGASIGANATVVCGNTVGEWALVAAGAVVTKDVPSHALVAGIPAKLMGWVCTCAHSLQFVDASATCSACGRSFEIDTSESIREVTV
jgi:UDP-2-acetamido-3-amino-2,3-dideoxy-glucuronate N-acetyltransferase